MNRPVSQMVSGAAGLLAGFAAVSIPLLLLSNTATWNGTAPRFKASTETTIAALLFTAVLAYAAYRLLRFALAEEHQDFLSRSQIRVR